MNRTTNLQINKLYTFYFIKNIMLIVLLFDCKIIKKKRSRWAGAKTKQLSRNNHIVKITSQK